MNKHLDHLGPLSLFYYGIVAHDATLVVLVEKKRLVPFPPQNTAAESCSIALTFPTEQKGLALWKRIQTLVSKTPT